MNSWERWISRRRLFHQGFYTDAEFGSYFFRLVRPYKIMAPWMIVSSLSGSDSVP